MNIDKLTTAQLHDLNAQIVKKLGIYCMLAVSVGDVKDHLETKLEEGEIDVMPSDEAIETACQYVWMEFEGGGYLDTLEWIAERAIENSKVMEA